MTDQRIISKSGLVQRYTTEVNLKKVESVDVDQSIFGRMFNYESITVRGTGEGIAPCTTLPTRWSFETR